MDKRRSLKLKLILVLSNPNPVVSLCYSVEAGWESQVFSRTSLINSNIFLKNNEEECSRSQDFHAKPQQPLPKSPSLLNLIAPLLPSMADQSQADHDSGEADLSQLIHEHQEKAARLPPIEEIRTLLHHSVRGFLSTFSKEHDGYPFGSMVDFACDAYGSPIIAISSLAVHTQNLLANPKCSLLVAKDPEDRTDLIVTIQGDALPVDESNVETIQNTYMTTHPDAFWVDFGDFQFLRIEPRVVRFVSGVATASLASKEFSSEEFRAAKVDPIYQFSKPITSHMNRDHADDTKLIVQHYTSIPVEFASMLDVDSLGFNVKAGYQGKTFKLRIPFTRRATERKDVKTLIIEMLQAAKKQTS